MIAIGVIAGVALGVVFFGGLRLTTARMNRTRNVALLTVASFVARSLISIGGLFLVVRFLGLAGIASALLGFIAVQIAFLRLSMKGAATRCPK